jgi:DNA gyrase subunit A
VMPVSDMHELMMITRKGIIIRTGLDELREIGRNTAGVRMIKVGDDDSVVSAARILRDEDSEDEDIPAEETQAEQSGALPPDNAAADQSLDNGQQNTDDTQE